MNIRFGRGCLFVALLIAQLKMAKAHIVAARLGDFYAGALHPLTELQDLILWAAMGVLAGSLGAARGRWVVLLFPLGLLAGFTCGRAFSIVSLSPAADAGTILLLGLLLAAAISLPTALLCAIAFLLAAMRGATNAGDLAPESDRLLFATGLACAGYASITLIMALTLAFRRADADSATAWRAVAIRAFGGWIAAIGLMMVGFAFAS